MGALFDKRLEEFQKTFERAITFRVKRIINEHDPSLPIALFLFDAMINSNLLNRDIVFPLSTKNLNQTSDDLISEVGAGGIFACALEYTEDMEKAKIQIASGDCVIMVGDEPKMIIADIKGMVQRSIQPPDGEVGVMGPQEGFNESIIHNLALVKKRLSSPYLKSEMVKIGRQSNTAMALCYMENIAKKEMVDEIRKKLSGIDIDGVWDASYIIELLSPDDSMVLPTAGRTQRPDVFSAKLCEGRIGIIINGTPVAVTLPFLYTENFQVPDDYYLPQPYGTVGRILRMAGFWLSFLVPSIYLSLLLYHPEMLPSPMLYSITAAGQNVPLSALPEMLLLFIVFEILRETGSRMPQAIGLALNIVGAIVLGQAAVEAKFVSAPMVIIVAFSGTVGLMIREMRGSILLLRFAFILAAAAGGMFGVYTALLLLWCYLHRKKSFGVPYMYTATPFYRYARQDTAIRAPLSKMNYRQGKMTDNTKRQGKI